MSAAAGNNTTDSSELLCQVTSHAAIFTDSLHPSTLSMHKTHMIQVALGPSRICSSIARNNPNPRYVCHRCTAASRTEISLRSAPLHMVFCSPTLFVVQLSPLCLYHTSHPGTTVQSQDRRPQCLSASNRYHSNHRLGMD